MSNSRVDFTLTLNHSGPTVRERGLRCFLDLEKRGIAIAIDANGSDLILTPAEAVTKLPYVGRLGEYKEDLLALTKYVAEREKQQDRQRELHANDIAWKAPA